MVVWTGEPLWESSVRGWANNSKVNNRGNPVPSLDRSLSLNNLLCRGRTPQCPHHGSLCLAN